MYPAEFYSLFPPFPRDDKIFVMMSFAIEFMPRWENVIKPAISCIEINGTELRALRVDQSIVIDSILTEILTAISQSRLIIADISTIGAVGDRPVRNGNVMYEVGLAQAVRLPEEILLFRSDNDSLIFDIANVRVIKYDPENHPNEAQDIVAEAIFSAFKEIDLKSISLFNARWSHLTFQAGGP